MPYVCIKFSTKILPFERYFEIARRDRVYEKYVANMSWRKSGYMRKQTWQANTVLLSYAPSSVPGLLH